MTDHIDAAGDAPRTNRPGRRWAWSTAAVLLLASLTVAALRGWLPFLYIPSYAPSAMTTIPTERTTHCVGRYLVTLPSNFALKTGGWGDIELYYGLDANFQRVYATVKPGRYTNEAFWKDVNKRRFELNDKINGETKGSMLLHEEQINTTSALLRRLGSENYGSSIKSEVHVLVGERYVTLEQESYSKSHVLDEITYKNADPAPAETRLKMIAAKLLPYENAERAKPGFCMQGVLFDVGQDDETATFNFYAEDMGDVVVEVDYHAVTGQPSEGILKRRQDAMASDPRFRTGIATVRERITPLGGAPAEESLTKTTHAPIQHFFDIERRDAEPRTLDRPFFGVALKTGMRYAVLVPPGQEPPTASGKWSYSPQDRAMVHDDDDASLSDDQALQLWSDIVASVRKR